MRMSRLFNNENALINAIKKNQIRQIKKVLPSAQYETKRQRSDNYFEWLLNLFLLSCFFGCICHNSASLCDRSPSLDELCDFAARDVRTSRLQSPFQVHQQLFLCDATLQQ